jgi:hypothetical protein
MFVVPLFVLILTYSLITRTLCKGIDKETRGTSVVANNGYGEESSEFLGLIILIDLATGTHG